MGKDNGLLYWIELGETNWTYCRETTHEDAHCRRGKGYGEQERNQ